MYMQEPGHCVQRKSACGVPGVIAVAVRCEHGGASDIGTSWIETVADADIFDEVWVEVRSFADALQGHVFRNRSGCDIGSTHC